MLFSHEIDFDPAAPGEALDHLPANPAVFCLRGSTGEPYLNRTADLRRRLRKLLMPAPEQTKRLQLTRLVRRIAWVETASEFTAHLILYRAAKAAFGVGAAQRLHLRAPFFLRLGMSNRFPRLWVTNALSLTAAEHLFGPFASRNAAERYAEQVLDLHLLRRCFQDLEPDPAFPGCIYSEMKKCLAPCYAGCSDERYSNEAAEVQAFLRTRGASMLTALAAERDRTSEALDFEAAAAAHTRHGKVETVAANAPEITGALAEQSALLVQPSAMPDQVDLFRLQSGAITGPAPFSLLGIRLHNEGGGSSSLFSHPVEFRPTPLGSLTSPQASSEQPTAEDGLRTALLSLTENHRLLDKQELGEHQALLARWYFRPEKKREGEILLLRNGEVPFKLLLRACSRVYRAQVEQSALMQAPV